MAEQLETVDASRQEFVANVSHELKTPLSSMKILGESLFLQENVPNEMYAEFLGDIISEIDRMTNIINELLTIVKLDATEQALNISPVSLGKMLGDIVKRLSPLAVLKRVDLSYEESRLVVIDADEMKLSLAVSNLIENGIKYTQEGGSVHVLLEADHASAFITVSDNGIGISEDDQPKVFVRFYRADKARDRESGGTGLGLAITHKTILLHNGSIKLSSREGEGSTFVVRLPIRRVER
jgi:signal transduction histidine kinase